MLDRNDKPYPDDVSTAIQVARDAYVLFRQMQATGKELNRIANITHKWDNPTMRQARDAEVKFGEAVESFREVSAEKTNAAMRAITRHEAGLIIFPPPAPTTESPED